ncbi:MAG: extracellular solute-binding protein [Ancrocorticia sp.]
MTRLIDRAHLSTQARYTGRTRYTDRTSRTRLTAGLAALAAAAVALSGCSGGSSSRDETSAAATSLADFGTLADLEAKAKEEAALNVIGLPRNWANYGKIIDLFKEKYPEIKITESSPDASSAEIVGAAKTNKGLDTSPDVFDIGLSVVAQNIDLFTPYKVETWDQIPDDMKDPEGLFTGNYGGYMSIGFDSSRFEAPQTLQDLLKPEYRGAVALNGDPTQAGAAFGAVGFASIQNGGSADDFQPGIDFFGQMHKAGNLLKVDVTEATITSGETPVVFDWDYNNIAFAKNNPKWETVLFPDLGYASYYNYTVNADAPHPAAARLWLEHVYSDEVQNLWLEGGARPARLEAMIADGTANKEAAQALPPAPAKVVVLTNEQNERAGKLLGEQWAAVVK